MLADSLTSAIFAVVSLTTVRTLASDVGHRRGRCEMTGDGIEFHASHALRFRLVYCPALVPSIDVFACQLFPSRTRYLGRAREPATATCDHVRAHCACTTPVTDGVLKYRRESVKLIDTPLEAALHPGSPEMSMVMRDRTETEASSPTAMVV